MPRVYTLGQRYNKRCRICGTLFGNRTAGRLTTNKYCSRACWDQSPTQQRTSRTREVERLWEEGILHQWEIAKRVGLSTSRTSVILRRYRQEAERDGRPYREREY